MMLVSWNWLNELVNLPVSMETVAERLTVTGNEIEAIHRPCEKLAGIVVAQVTSIVPHPRSGNLLLVDLDRGNGSTTCVTAAKNLSVGDKVPYAPGGATIADGTVLSDREFDGVVSSGMMLSAEELGLPDVADEFGILRLPEHLTAGDDAVKALGLDDFILELSITPNRGDMLSMRGIAREVIALFPEASMRKGDEPVSLGDPDWDFDFKGITLEDDGCPVYLMGMAERLKIAPSPLEARIRLALCGMRPVNNVVDVTNLTMLALGQPLHAFDADRLPDRSISVRSALQGERFVTLDHKERVLDSSDLVICSGDSSVALAGVMGGLNSEIEDGTTRLLLESAIFDSARIGSTSRRLGLPSEASYRYARGVDPELPERAIDYAFSLLRDWGCAEVASGVARAFRGDTNRPVVSLTKRKLARIAQWDDMEEASSILSRLGLVEVEVSEDGGVRSFKVPSYRPDISIEEDLVEEVARIRGYDVIPSRIPGCSYGTGKLGAVTATSRELRSLAIARGYVEVVSYSFHSPKYGETLRLEDDPRGRFLSLSNPISGELSVMRSTMLPGLLESLRRTLRSGWRGPVRLFESGRVFRLDERDELIEFDRVSGLVYPGKDTRSPYGESVVDDLLSVKADVQSFGFSRNVRFSFVQGEEPFGHLGQTAHIVYDGAVIGFMVRLKPAIESELDLDGPVYCFEFDLAPLLEDPVLRFGQGSSYPPVFRDVSLLADSSVSVESVIGDVEDLADDLLDKVRLFDIYDGKGIPEGKRSLAFSMAYRSSDRTLKDKEVDSVHDKLRSRLEEKGYSLR
ncbi:MULTISPECIES: phenylalanine--tRNA ligase subunit beta [Dethiosulfovibrio]|jgi:phenylalanyl-tRNA synthetase beta chain|uniref:Phenylalanine--tRNA ligase beta subunit n=2 Tax=Dethiosulfovibrio TaxID=47054 RepID=A0ABS9EQA1_9BACT|nr:MULTISPECIES: phenylalanine--tRNA ligase subunit beta [Dethiosulfovibrio]MCF4115017.1 phenylalanine--tRNA ligase subunit beta [Dethiosulfovibrio russensis]MCF4143340.1 phenylalanine--tRNA ligase subunit beta [Dethiosulfovibrio marinus]